MEKIPEDTDRYYYSKQLKNNKRKEAILKYEGLIYKVLFGITVISVIFSTIYFSGEQQIGFVNTFGKNTIIESAGLHFKLPFVSKKYIYDSTTKDMPIGYTSEDNESIEEESLMITKDFNFVNIDFNIAYRISDPIEYCYGSSGPENILKNVAQSAIRNTVGQYNVDPVMTTGKSEIEAKVYEDIVEDLAKHPTGLSVVNVTIQDSEPPTKEVSDAFKAVETAKQDAETALNKANKYENTKIPEAEATAESIKQSANAYKTERINQAKEEVAKFNALFSEYKENPETVKLRLYYEALEEILPKMEIIIGEDSKVIYIKQPNESEVKK